MIIAHRSVFLIIIMFVVFSNQSYAMMRFTRFMPYISRPIVAAAHGTSDASSENKKEDTVDVFGPGLRDGQWKKVPRSHWEKGIDNAAYLTPDELRWYLRDARRGFVVSEAKRIGFRIAQPLATAALIVSPAVLSVVRDPQEVLPELMALTVAAGATLICFEMSASKIHAAYEEQSELRRAYVNLLKSALARKPQF